MGKNVSCYFYFHGSKTKCTRIVFLQGGCFERQSLVQSRGRVLSFTGSLSLLSPSLLGHSDCGTLSWGYLSEIRPSICSRLTWPSPFQITLFIYLLDLLSKRCTQHDIVLIRKIHKTREFIV